MIALPCLCANLRRAARVLTQRYEQKLRPLGITSTHFTILQALSLAGEVSQGRLGEILGMDSTTLTRTLGIMKKHGWVAIRRGADRRERLLSMSAAGKTQYTQALPHWQAVQDEVRRQLGKKRWRNLMKLTNTVASSAAEQGDLS